MKPTPCDSKTRFSPGRYTKAKCITILSTKSSGSSALQYLLADTLNAQHVTKSRHGRHETLYWTKAASILGLPQINMKNSEVPIGQAQARDELRQLLRDNLGMSSPLSNDDELIFNGFRLLCEKYGPLFIEKSPHHLHQWAALELLLSGIKRFPEINFLFIGLIRNPMDTLYSMWQRWRNDPELHQAEWVLAYKNLQKYSVLVKEKLFVVRYEDMVGDVQYLKQLADFVGVEVDSHRFKGYLHRKSLKKWLDDDLYGFQLNDEVVSCAMNFGYQRKDMVNRPKTCWPLYKGCCIAHHRSLKLVKLFIRYLKKWIKQRL